MNLFPDLPHVRIESRPATEFHDNATVLATVLHVRQDFAGTSDERSQLHAHLAIPDELLADSGVSVAAMLEGMLDRTFRPWRYPDPNPMPTLVLFPRVAQLERRWYRLEGTKDRLGHRLDEIGDSWAAHYRARRNRRRLGR